VDDVQPLVENDDSVGAGFDDAVRPLLSQALHVRNAHFHLSHAANDGLGFVATGGISAGAAIELVLGARLAGFLEDSANFFLRDLAVDGLGVEPGDQMRIILVIRGRLTLVLACIVQHIFASLVDIGFHRDRRSVNAALGAEEGLDNNG